MPICNITIKAKKPCRLLPSDNDTSLGAELKRRRLALEMTQRECAEYMGISKDSYQNYEWNEVVPDIEKRKIINDFLGFNYWDDGTDSLSNKLICYRIERGITRQDLAKQVGVSDSTIERIEKMNTNVSETMMNHIASLLEE